MKGQGQVAPPRYLSGDSEGDPMVVWRRSLAAASARVAGPPHPGCAWAWGRVSPVTMTANLALLEAKWTHSVFTGTVLWPPFAFPPLA